jgi:hypothetical protein
MTIATVVAAGTVFIHTNRPTSAQSLDSTVYVQVGGYSGNIVVNSGQHQFGSCNSQTGETFYIPATCQGYQFGPPDGVTIYLAQGVPSGYTFTGWSTLSNSTDGTVSCSSNSCFLNFSYGTATIRANFQQNRPAPPSAPSPYIASTTQTSITLKWGQSYPGSGAYIVGYNIIENGRGVGSTSGQSGTTFTHSGLTCNTSHTYYVSAVDNYGQSTYSGPASGKTAACPAPPPPPPPPAPTPTPTPTPSPQPPQPRPLQGSSNTANPTPTEPVIENDTTPPSVPTKFVAVSENENAVVQLGWEASTDNIAVRGYKLERSTDKQTWDLLSETISGTYYKDDGVTFDKTYTYRVSAIDTNNNASTYALVDVTTPKFAANVKPGEETTITSTDRLASITIPAGAVKEDLNCSLGQLGDLSGPDDKHVVLAGPYQLICKHADGSSVSVFDTPLKLSITRQDTWSKYKSPQYYVRSGDSWSVVKDVQYDKTTHQDSFSITNDDPILAAALPKSAPVWPKVVILLLLLAAGGFAVVHWLVRRRAQQEYEDYMRKAYGL